MQPHVRVEDAPGRPADKEFVRGGSYESAHIVAPEGEPGEPETEPAPQGAQHVIKGAGAVTGPVNRVPLRARVSAACPQHRVPGFLSLNDLMGGLVVKERVGVLELTARAAFELHVIQNVLPEVGLYGVHAHIQQPLQLFLVKQNALGPGEVDVVFLYPQVEHLAPGKRPPGLCLLFQRQGVRHVGPLPYGYAKIGLVQLPDHALRVREAPPVEPPVTMPFLFEPARVQMDHIRGPALLADPAGNREHLFLGEIAQPAHPESEAPLGHHGCPARERGVVGLDPFERWAVEEEHVQKLPFGCNLVAREEAAAHKEGHGQLLVHENTVSAGAHKKGYVLVISPCGVSCALLVPEAYGLTPLVHRAVVFPKAENRFTRP